METARQKAGQDSLLTRLTRFTGLRLQKEAVDETLVHAFVNRLDVHARQVVPQVVGRKPRTPKVFASGVSQNNLNEGSIKSCKIL